MPRILVVEDHADLADLVVRNLVLEGFEARTTPDGRAVLPLVRSWRPDLVILDLMLPASTASKCYAPCEESIDTSR